VNGDGRSDIICAAGPGGGPNVTVISGLDGRSLLGSFFPFPPAFTGGVYVAAGDANGDGFSDVVCGAGSGGGPNVAVVSGADLATAFLDFFPYDPHFGGGVRVGAVVRNFDRGVDVICVPGPGGGPDV